MKKLLLFTAFAIMFASCGNQLCKQTVSYTKAIAIYGDIDEIRNQPVNVDIREIENPGKIYIGDDFILIGEEGRGIHVLDNTNPNSPIQTNFIQIHQNKEFYVEGDALYAESFTDVVKYDISNINNVRVESRASNVFNAPNITNNVGERLIGFEVEYVTEDLDCDSPIQRDQVNFFGWDNELIPPSTVPSSFAGTSDGNSGTINRITYANGNVFLINWNTIYSLSDNGSSLIFVGEVNSWRNMETIFHLEDNLFIGTQTGMEIYSIDNPNNPELFSSFDHANACDPVLPKNDVAYVTLRSGTECFGFSNQLDVIDISNLNNPSLSMTINLDSPYGMAIINETLYVGQGDNGISVFDISNPLNPSLIKQDGSIKAYDVIANPSSASRILVTGQNGASQYEVSSNNDSFTLLSSIGF
jgi:hypothetical protein